VVGGFASRLPRNPLQHHGLLELLNGLLSEFSCSYQPLDPNLLSSAEEYLDGIRISQDFKSKVIEPRTRFAMERDLTGLTGLDMVLAMAEGKRKRVLEGNYRLIDRLFRLSNATLRLNSQIRSVTCSIERRYKLLLDF
jgi:hypothetical protein